MKGGESGWRSLRMRDLAPPVAGVALAPGREDARSALPAGSCRSIRPASRSRYWPMGVPGRPCGMATLTRWIGEWRAADVLRWQDMGRLSLSAVPENIKPAAIKPARCEPVLEEA